VGMSKKMEINIRKGEGEIIHIRRKREKKRVEEKQKAGRGKRSCRRVRKEQRAWTPAARKGKTKEADSPQKGEGEGEKNKGNPILTGRKQETGEW